MGDINVKDEPDRVVLVNAMIHDDIGMCVGSVVVLKSGGPKMTVTHVSADDYVSTTWFDDAKIYHHNTFPAGTLQEWKET